MELLNVEKERSCKNYECCCLLLGITYLEMKQEQVRFGRSIAPFATLEVAKMLLQHNICNAYTPWYLTLAPKV